MKEIAEQEKDPFRRRKALEKAREKLAPVTDFDAIFIPDFAREREAHRAGAGGRGRRHPDLRARARSRSIRKTTGRPDLGPVQLLGANGWGGDPDLFDMAPGGPGRHVRCAICVDGFFAGLGAAGDEALRRGLPGRSTPARPRPSSRRPRHDAARDGAPAASRRGAQTRAALRDGLAALRGFNGATGDITMGPARTPREGALLPHGRRGRAARDEAARSSPRPARAVCDAGVARAPTDRVRSRRRPTVLARRR